MSGGKSSLRGGKIAERWLEPTTSDQCGENPVYYTLDMGYNSTMMHET